MLISSQQILIVLWSKFLLKIPTNQSMILCLSTEIFMISLTQHQIMVCIQSSKNIVKIIILTSKNSLTKIKQSQVSWKTKLLMTKFLRWSQSNQNNMLTLLKEIMKVRNWKGLRKMLLKEISNFRITKIVFSRKQQRQLFKKVLRLTIT